jgi:hypothetical protein
MRLAEQVAQFGVDVDVAAFLAVGDDLVGPAQEVGDFPGWGLEARLAAGRGQLDGQHAAGLAAHGSRRRPHLHVADALAALDAPLQCRLVSVSLAPGWMNHRHTIAMISCPPPGHA